MADWKGPRYEAGWVYRRVSWETWEELEEYGQMEGCRLSMSISDSLKVSGTLDYSDQPPDEVDLVRAYYAFTDSRGEEVMQPVATLLVEAESPEFRSLAQGGARQDGSLKAYSVLKVLSDMLLRKPTVVPAGTQAVREAARVAESAGLRVSADPSDYATKADKSFEAGDSWLAVVNWLLDSAGFSSAWPDAYGTCRMTRYVEPTERPTAWAFANDGESTMGFGVTQDSDWRDIPNAYTVNYAADGESLSATARNVDPSSRASLPSRGWREHGGCESVDELDGGTAEERLESLKAIASSRLKAKSSEVCYVTLSTLYVPVGANDAVSVDYSGRSWRGCVASMSVSGDPGGTTELKIREFVRHGFEPEVSGEVLSLAGEGEGGGA